MSLPLPFVGDGRFRLAFTNIILVQRASTDKMTTLYEECRVFANDRHYFTHKLLRHWAPSESSMFYSNILIVSECCFPSTSLYLVGCRDVGPLAPLGTYGDLRRFVYFINIFDLTDFAGLTLGQSWHVYRENADQINDVSCLWERAIWMHALNLF